MNLIERYEKLLGAPFKRGIAKRECLRVSTLLAPQDIIKRLEASGAKLEKVPWLADGYWYVSKKSLGATPEYLLGYYYLQEAASQLPAVVLAPAKDSLVLDMAASPGGKTGQLAAAMRNSGAIVALEQKSKRMEALAENLERLGVTNTVVYRKDARFSHDFHKKFSHILLDAPCSGNYVIEKEYFSRKSLATVREMQKLQRELLKAAINALAAGGTLVYSTCSLEPEEDEEQVDWVLRTFSDVTVEETGIDVGEPGYTDVLGKQLDTNVRKTRRLWPQKTGTQGFFIAKFRKKP